MIPAERVTQAQNTIDGLTALANATTKAGDTNITDAISTLIDGYNKGGGRSVLKAVSTGSNYCLNVCNQDFYGIDETRIVKGGSRTDIYYVPYYCKSLDRVMDVYFEGFQYLTTSTATNISDCLRQVSNLGIVDFGGAIAPATMTRFLNQWETYNNNPIAHTTYVKGIDFSNVTTFSSFCGGLPSIDLQIERGIALDIEWNGTIKASLTFGATGGAGTNVPNMTKRSLLELFEHLSTETTGTVSLGARLLAKLTADEIAIATSKGWTVN